MKILSAVGAAMACVVLAACGGGGGSDSGPNPPAVTNTAPVANAGVLQSVLVGTAVTLSGAASTDANGDSLTYSWIFTSRPVGSVAVLIGATTIAPSFTADVGGDYIISLVVNDSKANSPAASVTVTASVANSVPVANAGVTQNVTVATLVTLNGSASTDANNDVLTFGWVLTTKPPGSSSALTSANSATPTFTPDVAGSYVATLVVNDGKANSTASSVTVTASVANSAPVANAGTAQNVTTGTLVTLNGASSTDANSDPLSFSWQLTSRPIGSNAVLAGSTSSSPTFVADIAGAYVASLTVNDGQVNSSPSSVTVNATVANAAPVANAGVAQSVVSGALVTLNGSSSSDANGDPLSYSWTLTAMPIGSSAVLSGPTTVTPTFTADVAGTFVASLIVNDGKVNSATATTTVTATEAIAAVTAGNVYIQDFPFGPFNLVNLATGALTSQTTVACGGLSAVSVRPDGVAIGSKSDGTVYKVDPVSGRCATLFIAPEWLDNLAVAADGTIVAQSQATTFGAKQVYRFSSSGALLSKVALSGVDSLGGMAFASNGHLYGAGIVGFNTVSWFDLDPISGVVSLVAGGNDLGLSEVCIDSSNTAYGHVFGVLYKYNAVTGAPMGSLVLQRDLGLGAIVCR